jgi:hypothetical protein
VRVVLAVALAIAVSATPAFAQNVRDLTNERLSDAAETFGCSLVAPFSFMHTKASSNPRRVGAVHTAIRRDVFSGGGEVYTIGKEQIASTVPWCAPATDLPEPVEGGHLKGYRYYRGASASVKLEANKLFTLLNLGAEDVREFKIDVLDVKAYSLGGREREPVLRDLMSVNGCSPAMQHQRAQMLLGTCTGQLTVQVYFNRAFSLEALKVKLGGFEASVEAGWKQEFGEAAPCTANSDNPGVKGAEPADKKGDTAKKENTGKKVDAPKGGADVTKVVKDVKDAIKDVKDAVKGATPAPAPGTKGDAKGAKGDTKTADAGEKAKTPEKEKAEAKCHKSVTLTSAPGAVFGVAVSDRGALKTMIDQLNKK